MYTNPAYLTLIAVLAFLVYICIVDENAGPFLSIQAKILWLNIRKQWLLLKMKPDMWLMKWRMQRVLKKLQKDQELQALAKEHTEMMNARDSGTDVH